MTLFKPIWLILSGDYELVVIGTYMEALNKAKETLKGSFSITLFCKGLRSN